MALFDKDSLDNFKTYEDYTGLYIIESYMRFKEFDTVVAYSENLEDVMEIMDDDDLWDDNFIYYIDTDGKAYAPLF